MRVSWRCVSVFCLGTEIRRCGAPSTAPPWEPCAIVPSSSLLLLLLLHFLLLYSPAFVAPLRSPLSPQSSPILTLTLLPQHPAFPSPTRATLPSPLRDAFRRTPPSTGTTPFPAPRSTRKAVMTEPSTKIPSLVFPSEPSSSLLGIYRSPLFIFFYSNHFPNS